MPQASTSRRAPVELHRCRLAPAKVPAPFLTGYKTAAADRSAKRAGVLYQLKAGLPGPVGCTIGHNIIAARLARINKTTTHEGLHRSSRFQAVTHLPARQPEPRQPSAIKSQEWPLAATQLAAVAVSQISCNRRRRLNSLCACTTRAEYRVTSCAGLERWGLLDLSGPGGGGN